MSENIINKNLRRCGEYFIYSLWIQSQMVDLIILNRHPKIIKRFIKNSSTVPYTLVKERMTFWQKSFGGKDGIKNYFEKEFEDKLTKQDRDDLNTVDFFRNAIAHSSVSLGRPFLLYKPESWRKKDLLKKINIIKPKEKTHSPLVFKIDFTKDDFYSKNFDSIKRLDEIVIEKICVNLKIPHSRIR